MSNCRMVGGYRRASATTAGAPTTAANCRRIDGCPTAGRREDHM
jgi:hypothetical protein